MKVLRITSDDIEGLLKEIGEAMEPQRCSKEEAEDRQYRSSRLAYSVTRAALDAEGDPHAGALLHCSIDRIDSRGINGMTAALLCEAACSYLDIEQEADKEAFKTKFIACLDIAVQALGEVIEEHNDASTEQSTQVSSDQPPATS
ncbi:hypothetical protein LCGC14_1016970 [marine sediment metagenome]|uniref:Uncharacterized protein n=1 Tax=marine sediment metagenome TaxID=412755 RepID=A0A0F9QGT6_9ZZZZ